MKKKILGFITICILFIFMSVPTYAQTEKYTAGASFGKDSSDVQYTKTRSVVTEGWKQNSTGWWYQYSDGSYPASAWRKIGNNWYYFDNNGYWVNNNAYEKGTLKGIDVSHWQGNINWREVKNDGIEFAFIRIGRSTRVIDERYQENIRQANAVGIPVGVYYYSKAQSVNEAILDAQFVIKNITGYKISYPVVIDIEDSSQAHLSRNELGAIAKAFCDEIRAAGYTPMLYANENWCRNHIDMNQLKNVEKWIARYNYLCSADIPRDIWQCTSKGKVAGISGNVDINFGYTDYSKIISPRTAPVANYTFKEGSWEQNQIGSWFSYYGGGYPKNTWKQIDGETYWFDENGYVKTGWFYQSGNWYYLGTDGVRVSGWKQISSNWYFFDAKGVMQKNTWIGNYYLKSNGVMATNEWVDGEDYYVGADGKWIPNKVKITEGWIKDNTGWWYQNSDGSYPKNTWKLINNNWYYFNSNGYMHTGWLQLGTTWYYMKSSGEMATNQWVDGGNYYVGSDGKWIPNKVKTTAGWKKNTVGWWYQNSDGSYPRNTWKLINNYWYYFDENGYMQTGWLKLGSTWYYMKPSGEMVVGSYKINGIVYEFDSSGAWKGY